MTFWEKLIRSLNKNKRRKTSKLSQTWKTKRNQAKKIREDAKKCADRARALTHLKGR